MLLETATLGSIVDRKKQDQEREREREKEKEKDIEIDRGRDRDKERETGQKVFWERQSFQGYLPK